jgi:ferritin
MKRYTVLTLGLALTLPCWGAWADQNGAPAAGDQGAPTQAQPNNAAPDQNQAQPNNAAPDQNQAPPANQNPAAPNNPPADQNQPQPNNAAPDTTQPNNQNPAQPNNPAPDNTQPNTAQPNQVQPAPSDQRQPNQPQDQTQPNPNQAAAAANGAATGSPLRDFVSAQVNEVGELSDQIDQFRAAKRPDAVMAAYHMIRDHTLLADAARNVLARRGEISEPVFMPMQATANSPDELIQHDLQAHQQTLSQLQQMLANAQSPEERTIYQRAIDAVNKHLGWLNAMSQGQTAQIGFFGPTTPLNRIAGYREERPAARVAGYQQSQSNRPRRSYSQTHHRRYHRYHRARQTR